jgi:hypothetical protein
MNDVDVKELSTEVAEIFEELLDEPPVNLERLIEELMELRDELDDMMSAADLVDEDLGKSLATRLVELLERVIGEDHGAGDEEHQLAQAAARYFIERADGDDDDNPVGFDDDLEVFNMVARRLGYEDLVIGF